MNIKHQAVMIVLVNMLITSAHAAQPAQEKPDRACMFTTRPSSWRALDQQHMVLWGPSQQDAYLVTLFSPISDLRATETFAFIDSDHNGKLCGDGSDKIAAPNSKTDPSPNSIKSMSKLDESELIALGEKYKLQLLSPARIKELSVATPK